MPPIENTLSTVSSLADHLTWQLSAQTGDDVVQTIGTAIVGNLDEDGYLAASIQEIAVMGNWPEAHVNRVLALVHTFDPMGVAARDLQECLLLQLRHLGLENTPSEVIVRDTSDYSRITNCPNWHGSWISGSTNSRTTSTSSAISTRSLG